MNYQETLYTLRAMSTYQPGLKVDEQFMQQAWKAAFSDHDARDVLAAITKLGTAPRRDGQPFYFELRDVLQEVNAVVGERLKSRRSGPPSGLGAAEYLEWLVQDTTARRRPEWEPQTAIEGPQRPMQAVAHRLGALRTIEDGGRL